MRRTISAFAHGVPCLAFLLGASALAFLAYGSAAALPDRVVANVRVAGVDIGGMAPVEAFDAVSAYAARRLDETVTLTAGEQRFVVSLRELGADADVRAAVNRALRVGRGAALASSWKETVDTVRSPVDIELPLRFHRPAMEAALRTFGESIRRQATNASADIVDGKLRIKPHVLGVDPDVAATADAVLAAAQQPRAVEVAFVTRELEPDVLARDLEGLVMLGTFSTTFPTGQVNRVQNIKLGSSMLDGAVVAPGGVFSVNGRLGPRTIEKGFRVAPVYSGERTIMGVGGGICQIATTLYNAVLASDMRVVERHPHSKPVHYVPPGRDATVDYGSADFRFENTTQAPVVLRVRVDGGTLTASLLGKRDTADRVESGGESAAARVARASDEGAQG
jgi:vancomycin resistance protein YoaR